MCVRIYPRAHESLPLSVSFAYSESVLLFHFVKSVTELMRKRTKFSTVVSSGEGRAVLGSLGGGRLLLFFNFSEAATDIQYYV